MRNLTNPNTSDLPLPLTTAEVATLAKTGCPHCDGAGGVDVERPEGAQGPKVARMMCPCVQKAVANRSDVITYRKALCWAPTAGAADLVVRLAPAVKPS